MEPLLCEMDLGKMRKGTENLDMDRGDEAIDSTASTRGQTSSRTSLTTNISVATSSAKSAAIACSDETNRELLDENNMLKAELTQMTRKWLLLHVSQMINISEQYLFVQYKVQMNQNLE